MKSPLRPFVPGVVTRALTSKASFALELTDGHLQRMPGTTSAEKSADLIVAFGIGERESDIYKLFCLADEKNTDFLVRRCVARLAARQTPRLNERRSGIPFKGWMIGCFWRTRRPAEDGRGA